MNSIMLIWKAFGDRYIIQILLTKKLVNTIK
nr:MAG TPA: hypothetical protein [Caudoviricetes sp.]